MHPSGAEQPLAGIRVLSMEQAAALPYATRHLVDLGAEVIRVQSPDRPGFAASPVLEPSLFRGKRMLGLNLAAPDGPDVFRRIAARCDIVAHNYTPRVMRKFGIDFAGIRAVNPRVIYCALTGFGSSGPWAERPLFGPGAEAISGHNLLIGEPDAATPGRPGTVTYADFVCGTNLLLAMLAAVHDRRVGRQRQARFIDVCLYETAVAQLGPLLCERGLGAPLPERMGNADARFALHGVWPVAARVHQQASAGAAGDERYIAIAATQAQLASCLRVLGADDVAQVRSALSHCDGDAVAAALQDQGIAAAVVADAADIAADEHLWARGYFGRLRADSAGNATDLPEPGPAWSGGEGCAMRPPVSLGTDNLRVLTDVAGYSDDEAAALQQRGVVGEVASVYGYLPAADLPQEISRGFVVRRDVDAARWRAVAAATPRVTTWRIGAQSVAAHSSTAHSSTAKSSATQSSAARWNRDSRVILELPGSVASAYAARLFAELGWQVIKVLAPRDDPLRKMGGRAGGGEGGTYAFINRGKQILSLGDAALRELFATASVVIGDLRPAALQYLGLREAEVLPRLVCACVSPFGATGARTHWQAVDLTLQAASGFLFITGEYDQVPQQLPPHAAALTAGITHAAAIHAALIAAEADGRRRHLDLAECEALTAFTVSQHGRFVATGEIVRREGAVKHALRMAPAAEGFIYCAPGAVFTAPMAPVAELLGDAQLADARFATAEGRMQHWPEYRERMFAGFATRTAKAWFARAEALHLTFALVQNIDELLVCPQLRARQFLVPLVVGQQTRVVPGAPFKIH